MEKTRKIVRFKVFVLSLILLLSSCGITYYNVDTAQAEAVVYITRTGSKYHTHKCGNGTYYASTLSHAQAIGLTACSKCFGGSSYSSYSGGGSGSSSNYTKNIKKKTKPIKISKTSLVLVKGQSKKLKLKNATNKIIWSSTKKSVANVSTTGKVVAKKAGKATIVAKTGTQQKTCKVIVEEPSLSVKKLSLDLAETKKVKLSSCKHSVKWTSSNSSVAKVKKGTITAKEVGTAVIKATVHGKTYKCKVTVKKPELKEIVLKTNSVQMDYGEETQVQISTVPKKAINYYDISVQSSPKAIVSASLDEYYENNIILKSHNISGSAVVSVKMGQLTAECQINVIPCTIQSMTLNETTITLEPKKTKEIFYQVVPYKASDYYEAIWTSGNNQIVTVTTGTGIYRNCVTLNAVGNKSVVCHVIVEKPELYTWSMKKKYNVHLHEHYDVFQSLQ